MPLVRTPMIAPTKIYDNVPTLSPEEAADMIAEACVDKPVRIATRLGISGELLHALVPRVAQIVMNTTFRMFPDSAAAKGDKGSEGQPVGRGDRDAADDARHSFLKVGLGRRLERDRNLHGEGRALAQLAGDAQGSAEMVDQAADDGQADARALAMPGGRSEEPVGLEQRRQDVLGNAGPGVGDDESKPFRRIVHSSEQKIRQPEGRQDDADDGPLSCPVALLDLPLRTSVCAPCSPRQCCLTVWSPRR